MTGLTHSFVLISPEVTNWGVWAKESDRCEPGSGVQGFDLLTERDFLKLDKTGKKKFPINQNAVESGPYFCLNSSS